MKDTLIPFKDKSSNILSNMVASRYNFRKRSAGNYTMGRRTRARMSTRRAGSRTMTKTRTRGRTGQGVSLQHDRRLIYMKKRMPRYKRKVWKRFVNKVHAVAEKDFGSRTVVFNTSYAVSNQTPGNHAVGSFYLYGQKSNTSWANDLNAISALENFEANPSTAAGITVEKSTKLLFQSGVLDLTIRNSSTIKTSTGYEPSYLAKMELDVYEVYLTKDSQDSDHVYGNLEDILNDNYLQTKPIGGAGNEITIYQRGVTPWDVTFALGKWGVRILKKTKFFIANGDTITYQCRDPKRRVSTIRDLSAEEGLNKPRWTRCFLLIGKLVPGLTLGSENGDFKEEFTVGITRKYLYKVEGGNDDRTRYINA